MPLDLAEAICGSEAAPVAAALVLFFDEVVGAGAMELEGAAIELAGAAAGAAGGADAV